MKISLRRIGGVAATIRRPTIEVDTSELADPDRDELESLVARSKFFELPPELPGDPAARDASGLVLHIEDGERKHTVDFEHPTAPKALQDLVVAVRAAARKKA